MSSEKKNFLQLQFFIIVTFLSHNCEIIVFLIILNFLTLRWKLASIENKVGLHFTIN